MKKIITGLICFLFVVSSAQAQMFFVEEGGLYLKGNTVMHFYETDLENNGELLGADASVVLLTSLNETLHISGSSQPEFQNMELDGNCNLETNIRLLGNLTFRSGVMDLGAHELALGGVFLNETEDSYVSSSSFGEVVKVVDLLENKKEEPGNLGLSMVSSTNYVSLEVRRGHSTQNNGQVSGINRYYAFDSPIDLKQAILVYRTPELNGGNAEAMSVWTKKGSVWEENSTISNSVNEISAEGFQKSEMLSIFSASDGALVTFPTGFSPNGDGLNDQFKIDGIENYPNSRFVVFNQWGDVVFDESPYLNKWDGKSTKGILSGDKRLIDGTYFYIFMKSKDDSNNAIKGSFEIKSSN